MFAKKLMVRSPFLEVALVSLLACFIIATHFLTAEAAIGSPSNFRAQVQKRAVVYSWQPSDQSNQLQTYVLEQRKKSSRDSGWDIVSRHTTTGSTIVLPLKSSAIPPTQFVARIRLVTPDGEKGVPSNVVEFVVGSAKYRRIPQQKSIKKPKTLPVILSITRQLITNS